MPRRSTSAPGCVEGFRVQRPLNDFGSSEVQCLHRRQGGKRNARGVLRRSIQPLQRWNLTRSRTFSSHPGQMAPCGPQISNLREVAHVCNLSAERSSTFLQWQLCRFGVQRIRCGCRGSRSALAAQDLKQSVYGDASKVLACAVSRGSCRLDLF